MRSAKSSALDAAYADMNSALQVAPSNNRRSEEEIKRGIQRAYTIASDADDPHFKCDALMQGANLAMTLATREDALNPAYLPEAKQGFERIVKEHKDQTLYYGRALYGLFQVEANQFAVDGDPAHRQAAVGYLEAIKDNAQFRQTPFESLAISQLNAIDEIFTKIEFAAAPPKPTTTAPAATQPATAPATRPSSSLEDEASPQEESPQPPATQPAQPEPDEAAPPTP
jgi:hypothetical protein